MVCSFVNELKMGSNEDFTWNTKDSMFCVTDAKFRGGCPRSRISPAVPSHIFWSRCPLRLGLYFLLSVLVAYPGFGAVFRIRTSHFGFDHSTIIISTQSSSLNHIFGVLVHNASAYAWRRNTVLARFPKARTPANSIRITEKI